jgi:predicted O-linked N-acetylglucosamine transferase (SPINDLY family)
VADVAYALPRFTASGLRRITPNGLPRISRSPAPIQVNYKNWVASSGIPALTYNIGDRIVSPPELQADYTEAQVLVANSNPKP